VPQDPLAQLASHRGHGQDTAAVSGVTTCRVSVMQASPTIKEVRTELDSHADTCVVGDETALTYKILTDRCKSLVLMDLSLLVQGQLQVLLAMLTQEQGTGIC